MSSIFHHLALFSLLLSASAQTVLKTFENQIPTIYYDNLRCENGNPCGATWGPTWSDSIVSGYTKCESNDVAVAKPLSAYKTNQIVAIDLSLFGTAEGIQKYCGKKVRVTKPDGTEYISPGGDLSVWDSCEACMSEPRVDFSAPDQLLMTGSTGDKCGIGEAAFKVEILDQSVVEYGGHPPDAPGGVDTFSGEGSAGAVCVAGGEADGGATAAVAGTGLGTGAEASTSNTEVTAPLVSTPAMAAPSAIASASVSDAPAQPVVGTAESVPAQPVGSTVPSSPQVSAASTAVQEAAVSTDDQSSAVSASASSRTWGSGRGGRRPHRSAA